MSNAIANQLYLAYLGRPSDTAWRNSTTAVIGTATSPSVALQNAFYSAAVLDGTFSLSDSSSQLVNKIFLNVFGFSASTFEQNAWATLINNGTITAQTAAWTIFSSYLGATNVPSTYQQPAQSKLIVLDAYTNALANDSAANLAVSSIGGTAAQSARTFISTITSQATAATAVTGITATVATVGTSATGSTFTLTTSADNLTGTSSGDTFNAYIDAAGTTDTFTAADTINGGAGTDTIEITVDGNGAGALPAATISNLEVYRIREVGGTAGSYDFSLVAGETSVVNKTSTDQVTFTNVGSGASVTITGDGTTTNAATIFSMASATDAVSLILSGGTTGTANVTRNATGAATVTVTSTGAANTIGILDLDTATAVKGLTISAASNLTASLAADYAASSALTVTGAATLVDISGAALSANFNKVDASGMTAGGISVKVNQGDTTVDTQFIGGTGADTLDIGNVVYNSTTLTAAGGAGTDILKMNDQAALTSTTAANLTGFETLSLYDDDDNALDTFNASTITGLTGIVLAADSANDGYSLTNVSSTLASAITIAGTQAVAPVIAVSNATVVGNLDTVSISINDSSSTVNTITLADLTLAGVETLKLSLTDNLTFTKATGLTAFTNITVTGAGALSLTTDALALNVNSTIDASASTGTVTVDASAGTTNGLAIKGSSTKANTITGTNQNDAITGGTAVDTVKNQANAATDSDTVDFVSDSSADSFEITTLTGLTTITNFDAATATTAEDIVNVSNDSADGGEIEITAAAAAQALVNDRTYVIKQTVGAAGALFTGGTATLATADYTAATLTNVAAYLSERFTQTANTTANEVLAVIVLNNGTNSYMYSFADSATSNTTVDANELVLIGVANNAIIGAEDVTQT